MAGRAVSHWLAQMGEDEVAEARLRAAARPLVGWLVIFLTSTMVLLALWRQLGLPTILAYAYLAAGAPEGWRPLSGLRRRLGFAGRPSLLLALGWSPALGAVLAPVVLWRSAIALRRLWREGEVAPPERHEVVPLPRRGRR